MHYSEQLADLEDEDEFQDEKNLLQDRAENMQLTDKNFYNRYIELSVLEGGKSFGELALIGSKPRMASIRCKEDTFFAVLSKNDFNLCLGQIEKKKLNEKINFLRSLPLFSALTKTSISKLTYQFSDISTIKGQILYKEGDPADYIFIVKSGQYEMSKGIV